MNIICDIFNLSSVLELRLKSFNAFDARFK